MKTIPASTRRRHLPQTGFILLIFNMLLFGCKPKVSPLEDRPIIKQQLSQVKHIVIIYLENHSFDNLYGQFAGADGLKQAPDSTVRQVDANNVPYTNLPILPNTSLIPTNLANNYFNIDLYIRADYRTPDVTHRYYQEQMEINGGKMNKFALYNSSAGLTMGYYKTSALPLDTFAKQYTLCDHFFHSVFGGSFLNHQWLIAAASPVFEHAPAGLIAKTDKNGNMTSDGNITPDGYVVNTSYSVNSPRPPKSFYNNDSTCLVPNQTNPTIGDRLTENKTSWAWYSGGWDQAMQNNPDRTFQYHHQPFIYYAKYADTAREGRKHLKDETCFFNDAQKGTLPCVSFIKPLGIQNEHPDYSDVANGEAHAVQLINAVLKGPNGKDAVIILTYDENGGFWDHVKPPVIDKKWGPGTRVPAIIIGPFAKKHHVDTTSYETVSILAFIEKRYGLKPLNDRDRKANPLTNAFNF